MVVGRLAPHTSLAPNTTLSTYPNCCLAASSLLYSHPFRPLATTVAPDYASKPPAKQTISHAHSTAPNSTTNHCKSPHDTPQLSMHLCLIHSHHPTSIISSQSPPSSPSFQPPKPSFQTATNDHRTRRRQPHRSAKTSYGCWGAGRSLPVPAAIWSGSQKPLVVVPPGQKSRL